MLLLLSAAASSQAWAQSPESSAPSTSVPEASSDFGAWAGLPIERVEVVQLAQRWRSPVSIQSVRPGEPMSAAVARRAARELLQSGGFADVSMRVVRSAKGVVLRLEAVPRKLVALRRMQGQLFDETDIWRDAGVVLGGELTEAQLPELTEAVRRFHVLRGYPQTQVHVETRETDDPMRVVLVVEVSPGPEMLIGRRIFVLAPELRPALQELVEEYTLDRGDRADALALEQANQALTERLHARGYPQASVVHRLVVEPPSPTLFVYVRPGPKLRFRFEGNEHFDADQLTEVLDYDKESDRTPEHLADKVRNFYRVMGFLDAQVRFSERGRPQDAIRDYVFSVREGPTVRVAHREFPCLQGGPRSASQLEQEIDSFLEEDLPQSDFFRAGNPAVVDELLGPRGTTGARPVPYQPDPHQIYVPEAYDRAIKHLQDLYRSEGYLSALVGPVQIVRRSCDRHSPPGQCRPMPLPPSHPSLCLYDASKLPVEEPQASLSQSCTSDPRKGVLCDPNLTVRIPIKLGPRASLYDIAFEGNQALTEQQLAVRSELSPGAVASNLELEGARRKLLDVYRELGYAYADIRASLELSPDHTRARARFTIHESQRVIVERIEVRGAVRTSESLILGRVALEPGRPYRQSDVRKTEERIATLGTFSSVSVSLQDAYVPARRKVVIVQVQERVPQYLDIRPGFSTGEGLRAQFEYGHLNIAGKAVQFTLRLRLSYLPDPFIQDPAVRTNLGTLPLSQRLERHDTISVLFPEVGLGPLVSFGVDGIDVRSNARDFGLTKNALSNTLNYRPIRTLTVSVGNSFERNDVAIFGGQSVDEYLRRPGVTSDLRRLLLVPDGLTYAVAQRVSVNWDRRDSPLGATRGTLLGGTIEHVRAFPGDSNPNTLLSDFVRLSGVASGYLRLSRKGLAFAATIRAGAIYQLLDGSKTYPDRLFFLGGVESLRGFLRDSVVPQDVAERIQASSSRAASDPTRLTVEQVAIRGGDVFINPRAEFRIPLSGAVQTTAFLDTGNVWVEREDFAPWKLRYAAGSGLRISTPIGPIALDYGVNLQRRAWEDFGAFHFSIGLF